MLSQIHEIYVGKNSHDYQAYNRTYHATHHLLNDKYADDDDDKTSYVISEVTHIKSSAPHPPFGHPLPKGRGKSYAFELQAFVLFISSDFLIHTSPSSLGERVPAGRVRGYWWAVYLNITLNCAGIGVSNSIGLPVTGW